MSDQVLEFLAQNNGHSSLRDLCRRFHFSVAQVWEALRPLEEAGEIVIKNRQASNSFSVHLSESNELLKFFIWFDEAYPLTALNDDQKDVVRAYLVLSEADRAQLLEVLNTYHHYDNA